MIDKEFVEKWADRYDYSSRYKYPEILKLVHGDIKSLKTLSREAFEIIIRWKAERNVNNIDWDCFEIYAEAIADALTLEGYKKVCRLEGLPGILLPNATTILHFIYPQEFPIVDIRTVRVLLYFTQDIDGVGIHYLDTRFKIDYYRYHLYGYSQFKNTMLGIARSTKKNLREIDKSLFSYDTFNRLGVKFSEKGMLKGIFKGKVR